MTVLAEPTLELTTPPLTNSFHVDGDRLIRTLSTPAGVCSSTVEFSGTSDDLLGEWWRAYWAGSSPTPLAPGNSRTVRTVELFSGAGGLGLGFAQACAELGFTVLAEGAVDHDAGAVEVYRRNHRARLVSSDSVSMLVDASVRGSRDQARFRYEPEILEPDWSSLRGRVDVVLAGPPCQGHSNLNNRTRRSDPRNELYLSVPAIAVALEAPMVIIENVPAVVHDRLGVVAATRSLLEAAGYSVETGTLHAHRMGWPQNRARFFLVARRDTAPLPLDLVGAALADEPRTLSWAIGELADREPTDFMDAQPELSPENRRRIEWLFTNDEYDLPPSQRPECHQEGTTYTSVYGRLYPDRPAPTITTGFMTPGRGRYIHPTVPRVLTPREAARLQGFPGTYDFRDASGAPPSKAQLGKWIGDAVPMPLGHAAAIAALGPGLPPGN